MKIHMEIRPKKIHPKKNHTEKPQEPGTRLADLAPSPGATDQNIEHATQPQTPAPATGTGQADKARRRAPTAPQRRGPPPPWWRAPPASPALLFVGALVHLLLRGFTIPLDKLGRLRSSTQPDAKSATTCRQQVASTRRAARKQTQEVGRPAGDGAQSTAPPPPTFCFSIGKDKIMMVAASQYVCRPLHMSARESQNSRSPAE